jgi:hypothetical protein
MIRMKTHWLVSRIRSQKHEGKPGSQPLAQAAANLTAAAGGDTHDFGAAQTARNDRQALRV